MSLSSIEALAGAWERITEEAEFAPGYEGTEQAREAMQQRIDRV